MYSHILQNTVIEIKNGGEVYISGELHAEDDMGIMVSTECDEHEGFVAYLKSGTRVTEHVTGISREKCIEWANDRIKTGRIPYAIEVRTDMDGNIFALEEIHEEE